MQPETKRNGGERGGGGGGRTGERGMSGKGTSKRAESRRLIKRNYATILHISQSKKGILVKLTLMKIVHLWGLISVLKVERCSG